MKTLKIINTLILISIIVVNIFFIGKSFIDEKYMELINNGVLFLALLIPFLTRKILKVNLSELFKFLYYIYIIAAVLFGNIMNLFDDNLWYDKIVHFYFGFMMALVAVLFIKYNKKDLKKKIIFNILFISGFTLLIAVCWEFVEFTTDKLFNTDHQRWKETGIDDTMFDLLVAFLGSIVININYYIEVKRKEFGLVFHSIRDDNNIKKDT